MKKFTDTFYWVAMVIFCLWFGYSKGWIFANYQSISAKEAVRLLENDDNISLLDVRTVEEYKTGHLKDAKLIPLKSLSNNLKMLKIDKKIIVYCRTGSRSTSASHILNQNGFTPLNVRGGIEKLIDAKATIVR